MRVPPSLKLLECKKEHDSKVTSVDAMTATLDVTDRLPVKDTPEKVTLLTPESQRWDVLTLTLPQSHVIAVAPAGSVSCPIVDTIKSPRVTTAFEHPT